jgi:hypothetical protein
LTCNLHSVYVAAGSYSIRMDRSTSSPYNRFALNSGPGISNDAQMHYAVNGTCGRADSIATSSAPNNFVCSPAHRQVSRKSVSGPAPEAIEVARQETAARPCRSPAWRSRQWRTAPFERPDLSRGGVYNLARFLNLSPAPGQDTILNKGALVCQSHLVKRDQRFIHKSGSARRRAFRQALSETKQHEAV